MTSNLADAARSSNTPLVGGFAIAKTGNASGPPAMVEAVRHEFTGRGLPAQQLFFDSFEYAPDVLAKLGAAAPGSESKFSR